MSENHVNVEKIMEEIRVQAKALDASLPPYFVVSKQKTAKPYTNELNSHIQLAADVQNVISEKPIQSHGGLLGRISIIFKKMMRKCLRFYIVPIVDAQNMFNERNVVCLRDLAETLDCLQTQMAEGTGGANQAGSCSLEELAITVRQTQARKLTLLEQESGRLAQNSTAAERTISDLLARVERQEREVELLRYQCAILEKKAALAD